MVWTEQDDKDVQECLDKLVGKQLELQAQLTPLSIIINNTRNIQTVETIKYTTKNKMIKIKPKDQWGNEITDEVRLKTKNECMEKTTELLDT